MRPEDQTSMRICLDFVGGAKRAFTDSLYNHRELQTGLGQRVQIRANGNDQYQYDVLGHDLLLQQLRDSGVGASVFSEESSEGWIHVGSEPEYIVVVDPFDQSNTTARTFRMAAVAICVMDVDYGFKACAIGDLNTHLVYVADESGAYASAMDMRQGLSIQDLEWDAIRPSAIQHISDAFIVSPGAKSKRREQICRSAVTSKAGTWLNVDGVLNLARLAAGYVDAYLDPFAGQPVYEIVCAELVQRAGGVVTDTEGTKFDLGSLAKTLRSNAEQRYPIVASCTTELHDEILQLLDLDRKTSLP